MERRSALFDPWTDRISQKSEELCDPVVTTASYGDEGSRLSEMKNKGG